MKKFLLVLFTFILFITPVYASTNTRERTDDDLKVPNKVDLSIADRSAIMSTPSVDATEKIYDFADLYTDDEEQSLYDKVKTFIDTYNMDFAIVTINENNKYSEVEYADDFYDYNDFDINGLLFLIDMDNRQIYMSTSGTAINMYTDARIDYLMDNVYQYMSDKEYYDGTSEYISLLSSLAAKGVPKGNESFTSTGTVLLFSVIGSAIITTIIMIVLVMKNKLVNKANEARAYLVKDSVKVDVVEEKLVSTHTTKTRIETDSSGGGSSTHSGSSGISHGGGGHGF